MTRASSAIRSTRAGLVVVVIAAISLPVAAQEPDSSAIEALGRGRSPFPFFWKPYLPSKVPPVIMSDAPPLSQLATDSRLRLSERDFVQLVVENNFDLQSSRYDYAIAQVDVLRAQSGQAARGTPSSPIPAALFSGAIGAGVSSTAPLSQGGTGGAAIATQGKLVTLGPRGNFDPTVSVNISYDRLVNPLNTTKVAGTDSVIVPSTVLQTRLQQELQYGTSYSISFNVQRQSSTQAGLLFNPALTSFVALQVYQPLLNGFGLALTRRFATVAANNREIVREAFRGTLNATLANALNAYWDLRALRETVRVAEQATAAAQRQYEEDRQRVEVGTMTSLDFLSAQSELASTRVQLLNAQGRLRQQQVILKALISKSSDRALAAVDIEASEPLPEPSDLDAPLESGGVAEALAKRSSLRQAQLAIQNQRTAEQYTRKNLLPIFSLYGAANFYGLAPGASPAVRQLVKWNYPEYSIGFTWSLPMFNRAAQADDMRARLETQEAEAGLERTKFQIAMQIHSATESLVQDREQVEAASRAVVASRAAFEGEQEKVRAGVSTAYRVMLAQRDLTSAQSAEIQARVNYAKASVARRLAVGGLLEHYAIDADRVIHDLWRESGH